MAIAKGFTSVLGFKKNTGATWGTSPAIGATAGDGVEFLSESLVAAVKLIENMGLSGKAAQLPGAKGEELHAGQIPVPIYYQGLEPALAMCFGIAGAPTSQGSGVYLHTLQLADSIDGIFATAVVDNQIWVREWPYVKVNGLEFTFEFGKQCELKLDLIPWGVNLNIGTSSTVNAVANAADANVTYTLVGQPTNPSQVTIVHTGTPTTFTVTVNGTDRDGNVISEAFSLTTATTVTTVNYFATVTSIVGSGLTGTPGTTQAGYLNGVNNSGTTANITLPTQRDFVLMQQASLLINDDSAGALVNPTNAFYISKFNMKIERNSAKNDLTTRFAPQAKIDEPVGDNFLKVTGGLNFSKAMDENKSLAFDYLKKGKKKWQLQFTGPIAGGSLPYQWTFYGRNTQFATGNFNVKGPGRVPFDLTFQGARGLAAATGFPATALPPITLQVQSQRSTDPLT